MAIDKPTASLVHDKRRMKKDGTFPVKLSIDYAGEKKRYNLPISCTIDDLEKVRGGKRLMNDELKLLKEKLNWYVNTKFNKILKKIESMDKAFTFELFQDLYFERKKQVARINRVYDLFQVKIDRLRGEGRIGTANANQDAQKSFERFRAKLCLRDITPDLLNCYEAFMVKGGRKSSTIGMYLRALRAIVNEAMNDKNNPITMDYPFSKTPQDGKYKIPVGKNVKKALPENKLEAFKEYEVHGYGEKRAKAFWLFSYYCNGANFTDILHLTFRDIEGEYIVFRREKTKRSKKEPKIIRVYLKEEMRQIIEEWGNCDSDKDEYIFPVLKRGLSEERTHQLVKQFVRVTNKYLKKMKTNLGVSSLSTYAARHSFATKLKRNGVNVAFISDSLGHSNITTTENYLGSFEDDEIKNKANLL